ncbi:MAG: hypothetical protein RIS70_922 [Planctomycetota bacterium]
MGGETGTLDLNGMHRFGGRHADPNDNTERQTAPHSTAAQKRVATAPVPSRTMEHASAPPATRDDNLEFWLDGEALICRCPDCSAPMSVRLWLMLADCWRCGASIELDQEQEKRVRQLFAEPPLVRGAPSSARSSPDLEPPVRDASIRSRAGHDGSRTRIDSPVNASATRPQVVVQEVPGADSKRPRRSSPRTRWLARIIGAFPAWLVSFVIHLVVLLLLALISVTEERPGVAITLSAYVGSESRSGEVSVEVDPNDELSHVQLLPDNMDLKDKKFREVIIAADQLARELRIDPNAANSQLPDLGRIKQWAASSDPIRRGLAVRDPRFRVQVAKQEGATTLTEAAVARALQWLSKEQVGDGHWESRDKSWNVAETALALLPFLGAGQTPAAGRYQDTVSKGLRWLIAQQKPDGDLRGSGGDQPGMYGHGIATIVLCDAYGLTGDELLRKPAQKAIDFIVRAQSKDGGWRYQPRQPGDTSVVGWQLMALQSARMSGLQVPDETMELASHYLDRASSQGGALYAYQPGNAPTPTMTAEGLLCRMYLGWRKNEPGLERGTSWLMKEHLPKPSQRNVYYWYYATQVFHHFGDTPWVVWNEQMRDVLVSSQVEAGRNAGSWDPDHDPWGRTGGRIFQTALSACTLEVYYRHAPIYRQIKLD